MGGYVADWAEKAINDAIIGQTAQLTLLHDNEDIGCNP
jgi:hypothetical protein